MEVLVYFTGFTGLCAGSPPPIVTVKAGHYRAHTLSLLVVTWGFRNDAKESICSMENRLSPEVFKQVRVTMSSDPRSSVGAAWVTDDRGWGGGLVVGVGV